MKAFIHRGHGLVFTDIEEPVLKEGHVKIRLRSAGLNHRDLNIPKRRGENALPLVLGSDGAGIIEEVGDNVSNFNVGDEVVINPGLGWIHNSEAPPEGFEIVGMPDHGTFAEKIVMDAEYVERKPIHLNWSEAGVLSLSALTGFRALFTKGKLKSDETVFIPGAGSGVATFLIKFAKAHGARVIVTSRNSEKLVKAKEIGADLAIHTDSDWEKELQNEQVDLVIESVGKATFNRSLSVLKRGGKIVTFGSSTEDEITINMRMFFYGQYQLLGSTMGSRQELREMLDFIKKHHIKPVVDKIYKIEHASDAFHYLRDGRQFGKIAFDIN